jgi:NAD(P)H dehydrogenase (quinone)
MILVTAANGQLGTLVIQNLLKTIPAHKIAAAVRNPAKAEHLKKLGVAVREADYTRPEQWPAALEGVEKVLLISSNEIGQRSPQHRTVVEAVKKAKGVKLLVYTSILHAGRTPILLAKEHEETEAVIRASGVPYSFLRNGWYTENYLMGLPHIVEQGAMYGASGEGRISVAARQDYAEAAAKVLTMDAKPQEVYELAGDRGFTLSEFAAELSRVAGKTVKYVDLSQRELQALLEKVGVPGPAAEILAQSHAGSAENALHNESRELSRLLGRPTTPPAKTIAENLKGGH